MKNLTTNPRVSDVECTRDKGNGIHLSYKIDGEEHWAQGEFWIDNDGVLHHLAEDDIEILVQYFDDSEKVHVTSIKRVPAALECYTELDVIRIDIDGCKGEFAASEWEDDLRERGFDDESVDMIIDKLDAIDWLQF